MASLIGKVEIRRFVLGQHLFLVLLLLQVVLVVQLLNLSFEGSKKLLDGGLLLWVRHEPFLLEFRNY